MAKWLGAPLGGGVTTATRAKDTDRQETCAVLDNALSDGELSGEMIETDLEDIVGGPVSRVIIRDPSASAEDFVTMAAKLGLHGTDYVVGWTAWLDLAPVGVSKASGLEQVADELGLGPEDTLAIGDGRNDIEMLRWAARGVAMGQAVPEVHEAADASTGTVYDDGAAVELRRWFP